MKNRQTFLKLIFFLTTLYFSHQCSDPFFEESYRNKSASGKRLIFRCPENHNLDFYESSAIENISIKTNETKENIQNIGIYRFIVQDAYKYLYWDQPFLTVGFYMFTTDTNTYLIRWRDINPTEETSQRINNLIVYQLERALTPSELNEIFYPYTEKNHLITDQSDFYMLFSDSLETSKFQIEAAELQIHFNVIISRTGLDNDTTIEWTTHYTPQTESLVFNQTSAFENHGHDNNLAELYEKELLIESIPANEFETISSWYIEYCSPQNSDSFLINWSPQ